MPKLSVYNMAGKTTGEEIELKEEVFGVEFNEPVVHQAIVMQQANQRLGTSATKTRGMVRGGGRKPWRQKGTGHARVGSTRSPLWVGGKRDLAQCLSDGGHTAVCADSWHPCRTPRCRHRTGFRSAA